MANICKNCRYFQPNLAKKQYNIAHGFCHHPLANHVNIITGETAYPEASDMRKAESLYITKEVLCGPQGQHYEKETNIIKSTLKYCGAREVSNTAFAAFLAVMVAKAGAVGLPMYELTVAICLVCYLFFMFHVFILRD